MQRILIALGLASLAGCSSSGSPIEGLDKPDLGLALHADHTDQALGKRFQATWQLVAHVDGGAGWVAITGRTDDGQPPVQLPSTHAVTITATRARNRLTLAPFMITLPDLAGSVAFDTLSIDLLQGSGSATGTYHARSFDQIEDWTFTGSLAVTPDTTPPAALLGTPTPPIALEAQTVDFGEPVDLTGTTITAMANGTPITLAATAPVADPASGLAIGVKLTPASYWPADAQVTAKISDVRDAAGNTSAPELDWTTAARPDPSANLGFELGLAGWLARTGADAPFATQGVLAGSEHVLPTEGIAMADVPAAAQLVGFLVPPGGATTLSLDLALVNVEPVAPLQMAKRGLFVDLVTPSGTMTVLTGGDLPLAASDALWTGFHTKTIPLPADASGGFWLIVRGGALEPPINVPDVLVDAIHF